MKYLFYPFFIFLFIGCSEKRILVDDLTIKGDVCFYNSKKFTGVIFNLHDNGKVLYEGKVKDGLKIGEHKLWFPNGNLLQLSNYTLGILNGKSTSWHENGQIAIASFYNNGDLDSTYKSFDSEGLLVVEKEYVNKELITEKHYQFGKLYLEKTENDGYTDYKEYSSEGVLIKSYTKNGSVKWGEYKEYYNSGNLFISAEYVNGELNGEYIKWHDWTQFDSIAGFGRKIKHYNYLNGGKYGSCIDYNPDGYLKEARIYDVTDLWEYDTELMDRELPGWRGREIEFY